LALEEADVRFEVVGPPLLDGEKIMVVPFSLSATCTLGEEPFGHLLEVMERLRRQRVEPI